VQQRKENKEINSKFSSEDLNLYYSKKSWDNASKDYDYTSQLDETETPPTNHPH
jgi:hypothetical protein